MEGAGTESAVPAAAAAASSSSAAAVSAASDGIEVAIKWSGKQFLLQLPGGASVLDLKTRLQLETRVLVARQKLLGLKVCPLSYRE